MGFPVQFTLFIFGSGYIHFLNFIFASCWLFIFIAQDITSDLTTSNITAGTCNGKRTELTECFCKLVQLYTDAKQWEGLLQKKSSFYDFIKCPTWNYSFPDVSRNSIKFADFHCFRSFYWIWYAYPLCLWHYNSN